MDDRRFDALARSMTAGHSRRRLVKGIVGFGAVAAGVTATEPADAKRREEPPCTTWICQLLGRCRARNERCSTNAQCCSNRCTLRIADPKISACD